MINHSNLEMKSIDYTRLAIWMAMGAIPGLILISVIFMGTGEPDPSWGKYWMIKPLIMPALAGSCAGGFLYFSNHLRKQLGWNTTLVSILGGLMYLMSL
jgi:hypothetical protein